MSAHEPTQEASEALAQEILQQSNELARRERWEDSTLRTEDYLTYTDFLQERAPGLARAYLELLAENERLRENVEESEQYASGLEYVIEELQGRGEAGKSR